ncbi:MAG: DUF5522 domain-containing protein [Acidobacteriota bacterium]
MRHFEANLRERRLEDLVEGEHYYINERALLVFTRLYHLERGHCCGKACRHCPYDPPYLFGNTTKADLS